MIRRALVVGVLLGLMSGFGLGVYHVLASHRTNTTAKALAPQTVTPRFVLPGTIVVAQGGDLFALHGGAFTALTTDHRGWQQPLVLADGRIIAVARGAQSSALFLLDAHGTVLVQLSPADKVKQIGDNHWYFFPRLSADGASVVYSHDEPKVPGNFRVDLAIWRRALPPATVTPTQLTEPNQYTGGDVDPQPLADGGLIYAKYAIDPAEKLTSSLVLHAPGGKETTLTAAADDCAWPQLSPDGHALAMICTHQEQTARLVVASWNGTSLGPARTLVDGQLCAVPVWAPDGSGLAYLAPAEAGGGFQLWWLPGAAGPAPAAPRQVTDDLGLDATSSLAWSSR